MEHCLTRHTARTAIPHMHTLSLRRTLLTALGTLSLLAAGNAFAQSTTLVQSTNLVYQGAFTLPNAGGNGFTYGGSALAYNPANNSLFVVGSTLDAQSAEVSIPAIGGTATLLQALTDPLAGKRSQVGGGDVYIGGQLVYKSMLYVSAFVYYDGSGSQTLSHFSRSPTLSQAAVTGPYRVGDMGAGFYSGYMGLVPADWQSAFGAPAVTGNCCLSIISRTSYGPALNAFDPAATTQTAKPLVYYTSTNQTLGTYGASGSHPVFNGSTRVTGVVFPEGSGTVLFFGRTGIGAYCYGEALACNDPAVPYKGEHAFPYRPYVWAYRAADLAAVKAGTKLPWTVVPYATWELPEFGQDYLGEFALGGAAYDPATSRIFLVERMGSTPARIHVYKVTNVVATPKPAAPASLQVR